MKAVPWNHQSLTGQRIANNVAALAFVESATKAPRRCDCCGEWTWSAVRPRWLKVGRPCCARCWTRYSAHPEVSP